MTKQKSTKENINKLIEFRQAIYENGMCARRDALFDLVDALICEGTVSYTYDIANRLTAVGAVSYTWDSNGNLLSDGVNTYTYDHANRLTQVADATNTYAFSYNGQGDRLSQTVNGGAATQYTLDLNAGLTQVLSDGTNTYLYGRGRIAEEALTDWDYYLGDALGSVRQITNEAGAVTLSKNYKPFGETLSDIGQGESNYGFAGEYASQELIYLRARYYDPLAGRFLTKDLWDGDYIKSMSLNRWVYVINNPINLLDPSGMWYCTGHPDCELWISNALKNLKNIQPEGKDLVEKFEEVDAYRAMLFAGDIYDDCYAREIYKSGVEFIITNEVPGGFGMAVRPWGIYIKTKYISYLPEGRVLSLFAHELFHLSKQSALLAISIYGELQARQFEANLNVIQQVDNSNDAYVLTLDLHKVVDLDIWREMGNYFEWQPYAPPYITLIGPNGEQCRQEVSGLLCVSETPQPIPIPAETPEAQSTPEP